MKYTVETKGIQLPDGTVWGAGRFVGLRVVDDHFRPNRFHVYEVIGGNMIEKVSGAAWEWKEMRELVSEFVNRQLDLGNRVFDDNGELRTFTLTEETYY
jgi:hypothetical protein